MHVSYRKPFGLSGICSGERPVAKIRDVGRTFVDVPLKTPRWEHRKVGACQYLRCQIDLIFKEFIKPQESTWETFWIPRRPSGSPQEAPRRPPGDLTSTSHRPHIDQTSTEHRPNIDQTSISHRTDPTELMSTSHRTHIELAESKPYIQMFYRECELPISRLRRPYVTS